MSEPTIDEMLDWLDEVTVWTEPRNEAIRAILEEHRNLRPVPIDALLALRENHKLEAIRAFVERVEKRLPAFSTGKGADAWLKEYRQAVYNELAEMENETKGAANAS